MSEFKYNSVKKIRQIANSYKFNSLNNQGIEVYNILGKKLNKISHRKNNYSTNDNFFDVVNKNQKSYKNHKNISEMYINEYLYKHKQRINKM